jgi:potassium-transporting ATPase KdpC subunit
VITNGIIALRMFILMTISTGFLYPIVTAGIANWLFPRCSQGSLIVRNNVVIGSELIGQEFTENRYFWGRPSATNTVPYNAIASSGSNFGPTNPELMSELASRVEKLMSTLHEDSKIPIDLVTTSASGLDPHISPAAALWQVARVAKARERNLDELRRFVESYIENRQMGLLGEPRVNVLRLNLALDAE